MFRELCGESTLKNVALVTNMWGEVAQEDGEEREEELTTNFFKQVLDKGAQLARHHNTVQSAHDIIRRVMKNRPAALQIQRELVDEGKDIINTAAGEVINKELNERIRRHQVELEAVKEEMEQAMKDKDEETRRELEEETRKLQEHIDRTRVDLVTMTSRYDEEKRKADDAIRRVQEQAFQEMEKAHQEIEQTRREMEQAYAHRQQMEHLNGLLEANTEASTAEIQALQEQLDLLLSQRRSWSFWDVASATTQVALFLLYVLGFISLCLHSFPPLVSSSQPYNPRRGRHLIPHSILDGRE